MQSLTVPAYISKRKQACNSCRQRKRRCDAERPMCALCKKWGLQCHYTVPASARTEDDTTPLQYTSTLFGRQPFRPIDYDVQEAPGLMQFADVNFELPALATQEAIMSQAGYPTPDSGLDSLQASAIVDADRDVLADAGLPINEVLVQLVEIFFDSFYHVFPCFHKASFVAEIHNQNLQTQAPLLLYAICTVASGLHPDPSIKAQQNNWYEQARFLFDFTGRNPHPALRTIQAALCLVFHAYTKGDFSACWLDLGKAWRMTAALGMNRLDATHAVVMGLDRQDHRTDRRGYYNRMEWEGKTAIEREECRRTLWLLFMMDRNESWPTGWPNAIDERQFKIDIPANEAIFQAMTTETDLSTISHTPFTRDLRKLIASTSIPKAPLNFLHYLIVAHVLLGRVTEQIHSLHDPPDTPEYAEECEDLDAQIVKLRLSLPRSATSVLDAPSGDRGHVIWLNLILNTMSILLHYRSAGVSDAATMKNLFTRAVVAAKNTARIVKDAARFSIDLLLSAHIASSLYIAGCVLVIHWRTTGDGTYKDDIDMFALVFERMNDVFSVMGLKFKLALKRDLERDEREILALRDNGYKGLLADCSKWGFVQDEVKKMGHSMS